MKKKELPNNTNVTRVVEGGEPLDFKSLFKSWPTPVATGKAYNNNRIGECVGHWVHRETETGLAEIQDKLIG